MSVIAKMYEGIQKKNMKGRAMNDETLYRVMATAWIDLQKNDSR